MPYTPPAGNAVNASWQGAAAYTPPAGNAVNASWVPDAVQARIAVPGPLVAPAMVGSYPVQVLHGLVAVPGPLGAPAAVGAVVVPAWAALPGPLAAPAALGRVVVAGMVSLPGPLAAPSVHARVVRYQLRGEVRNQGVLVDRRVRAYRRSDGAMAAEADTVIGAFALDVGFAPDEYTVLPVDLSVGATDYTPPAANRVLSVLAQD